MHRLILAVFCPIVYPEEHKMKLARIPSLFLATVIVTVAVAPSYAQRRVLVLSWNVESGDNEAATIVKQLEDFEGFDILGLTEVRFSNVTDYADAAEVGEGAKSSSSSDFRHVVSASGAGDRMMIIWDNKRFEKIGNKTELTSFNDGTTNHQLNDGNHRSPMFCKFKIRGPNIEFLFMVNHLARGNMNLRNKQATGLKAWAMAQTLPVIAVGDWNFDYDIDDGEGNQAFKNLLEDDVWKWARPQRLHQTQLSPSFYSVLDFVFTANLPTTWEVDSWIRTDVIPAVDDNNNSDHRPLVGRFLIAN